MRGLSPRATFFVVFAAPAMAIISFYALRMATPGFWIMSWRVQVIKHLSIGTGILLGVFVDCFLWFALIWGAYALFMSAREKRQEKTLGLMASITLCAFPLSLYSMTGVAGFLQSESFSLPLQLAFTVLSFFLFFLLIVELYSRVGSSRK